MQGQWNKGDRGSLQSNANEGMLVVLQSNAWSAALAIL